MLSTILTIVKKTLNRGPTWLQARIMRELRVPETPLGKKLKPLNIVVYRSFSKVKKLFSQGINKTHINNDTLYLFYDLEVSAITFDFCWALALAEKDRKKIGLEKIHVFFVPGPNDGLREEMVDYELAVDKQARYWRIHNILIPATRLLPSCKGFTLCATREEAEWFQNNITHIFPKNYSVTFPTTHCTREATEETSSEFMTLRATPQALKYVQDWLALKANGRKTITITLREYNYMSDRNSNIEIWANFAQNLDPNEYMVIIVPDTETAMLAPHASLRMFEHFMPACWNIELRAALYESCFLNLGVNNGPFVLCWLNSQCRYLMFKIVTETVPQTTEEALKTYGFFPNTTPAFAIPTQKWVWKDDAKSSIADEFELMCAQLT